jgi:hypothetical protein
MRGPAARAGGLRHAGNEMGMIVLAIVYLTDGGIANGSQIAVVNKFWRIDWGYSGNTTKGLLMDVELPQEWSGGLPTRFFLLLIHGATS